MIEATGLSLSRGEKQVLADVSLEVRQGQVLGLLGRNGAGKTSTLKVLCGLLKPDSGVVRLSGLTLGQGSKEKLPKIGSLVETPGFYPNLTAIENLLLFSRDRSVRTRRDLEDTIALLGLSTAYDKRVGRYSLGMKQRLGIARAIAGHPDIVILDEPTNGLDPHGIRDIRDLIHSLASQQGITLIVSSHILSEVELVANVVTVIEEGRTVATIEVPSSGGTDSGLIEIEVDNPEQAVARILGHWPQAKSNIVSANKILVSSLSVGPGAINQLLVGAGHIVSALVPRKWSLETQVMHLMKKELENAEISR